MRERRGSMRARAVACVVALFVGAFCIILSMYGGGFATVPAYLADMFGTQMVGGIQSGMSYSGAHTIEELNANAVFVRMTGAGLRESHPHDVEVLG